jgi:hypothetical protein
VARLARLLALLLALAAAALTASGILQLATAPAGAAVVGRSAAGIRAVVEAALAGAATPAAVAGRLEALLAAEPRDWLAIAAVEEVAADRGLVLPPVLAARRAALHAADHGLAARAAACAACIWDPRACDLTTLLACRLPVDLTPVGDLAGLMREGTRHALGEEVDEVELVLSGVGLVAVALAPLTGGSSAAIKAGAGLARLAWKGGRLAPGLAAVLVRAAREGLDWAGLAAVRSADDLAALARPAALAPALAIAADLGRLQAALGLRRTLHLMPHAADAAELGRLTRAADALGPRTTGALEILGKGRLMRATLRLADEVWAAVAGALWLAAAAASAAGQALGAALLRALGRALR